MGSEIPSAGLHLTNLQQAGTQSRRLVFNVGLHQRLNPLSEPSSLLPRVYMSRNLEP